MLTHEYKKENAKKQMFINKNKNNSKQKFTLTDKMRYFVFPITTNLQYEKETNLGIFTFLNCFFAVFCKRMIKIKEHDTQRSPPD